MNKDAQTVLEALKPFAEPHAMGDNYVKFSPHLIENARKALPAAQRLVEGEKHIRYQLSCYQMAFNKIDDLMEYRGMDKSAFRNIANALTYALATPPTTREE